MSSDLKAFTALNVRVWYVEGGVHPLRSPSLLALGKFSTDPAQSIGDEKRITAPDPNNFDRDVTVGSVKGSEERATLGIGIRSTAQASTILGWKNKRCRVDIFALAGRCGNPQDFTEGGEKWVYFPDGKLSGHSYENFGAYGADENNPTNEKVDMTSEEYYELLNEREEQIGAAYTTRQVYTVDVYTGDACEECPDPCDRVLCTMAGVGATPGTKPVLLYSADGGVTWGTQSISTLFSNETVAEGTCIGGDYVIVSPEANAIEWTDLDLLYGANATNTWNETNSGFVLAKTPNSIFSADKSHTWIVANGGYIYFTKNHRVSVIVQDAGVATTQHLLSVHALDASNVLAVGNSNAVVYTRNGGATWTSVTGPAVGINLAACWMWDEQTWFVGEGAGGTGKLWLTVNSGLSWTQVGLPSTYARIYKIRFISEAEGYIAVNTGSQGILLRTITAGNEWVALPQGKGGVPVNNSILADLAVCSPYSNTAYAAGTATGGSTGIVIKASAGS